MSVPSAVSWAWLGLALVAGCGPKKPPGSAVVVGWHQEEGWPAACYHPPAWEGMTTVDRRTARTVALRELLAQWQGTKDAIVHFPEDDVTDLETVLLGEPDKIETVSVDNLERCRGAMVAGGDTASWGRWLAGLPEQLTEGQCQWPPLDYTLFDYLDIGRGWQVTGRVCQGDRVRIRGSSVDYYRIHDKGPWINVAGDPDRPAIGTQLPCNLEGCFAGQLILRFTTEAGVETIHPVGAELLFDVPAHGKIEVMINDDTWFDNVFKVEGSIEHHTSIEYKGDL